MATANRPAIAQEIFLAGRRHTDHFRGKDKGFVKVFTKKGTDTIIGVTILADNAGDMISELTVPITGGLKLSKIGSAIHPYPTQAEAIRKLGDQFSRTKLTPFSKKMLGVLQRINVGA